MADYHQIVDEIRAFVQSSDQTRTEALDRLASAYAEACLEVNQRMGRCHRLLQQGLRSEAIQLAESEPRLLDAIAALDFPERADWDDLVQIYELPAAPKLSVEQAQFLNESYAQEDPLQDLLRTHRRLALQRGPIRSRLAALRKLAAQDANNPIWTDDLRIFEKARFREVQLEAARAVQNNNLTALSRLVAEVEQQSWVEPPPKVLVQGLRKANAQLSGQETRAALTDLDVRLNDAFAARDPIRGRIARQEWITLTAGAPLEPADPIWDRVGPPLRWLEDQDRIDEEAHAHEESLSALVRALDDSGRIPPSELERLAHAVLQYGRGMSEGIQQRYVARLRSAGEAQARRWRVIASGAAAGVFLAVSLAFYVIRSWTRAGDATQAATAMLDMLELGEVEQAGGFLEKVQKADPGLLTYPPLIEARERLQVVRDKETDRIVQFDKVIRAAEQAEVIQLNPPELETARKLARLETEKQAVEQLVKRRAAELEAERNKHEKDVGPHLEDVSRKIAEIQQKVEADGSDKTDDSKILGLVADYQRTLADLEPALAYVGENLQSHARSLVQRLEAVRSRLDQRRQQARLEGEITDAVGYSTTGGTGSMVRFANGLDNFIKSFPNDPRSRAFIQAREDQTLWYSVEAWRQLATGWKRQPDGLTAQDAKLRAEQCSRFLMQHPGVPDAAEIGRYQKHLEAISRRHFGADSANGKIQRLLSDILVGSLWMVKVKEAEKKFKCYYLTRQPQEGFNSIRDYLVGFDSKERHNKPVVRDRIVLSDWSPQTRVANQFKPMLLQESTLSQWEKVMIDLANRIRSEPEIEPVLQVALLRSLLEQAAEGSEPLREALITTRRLLDQDDVNVNVPWMDPEDADAEKMRPRAAQLVASLPEFSEVLRQALARRQEIERLVNRVPIPMGWLAHEKDGWRIRAGAVLPPGGDLWVVAQQQDKRSLWRNVGSIRDGKPRLSIRDDSVLVEGQPVFVMSP